MNTQWHNQVCCATGHRPDKLGGYGTGTYHKTPEFRRLVQLAQRVLTKLEPSHMICGMALGWDQAMAQACIEQQVSWSAAIPFKGFEDRWRHEQQTYMHFLLMHARSFENQDVCLPDIQIVCEPGYEAWKLQQRNKWMVDHSSYCVALWDGSPGGTYNCIQYAKSKGVPVGNCWHWLQSTGTQS